MTHDSHSAAELPEGISALRVSATSPTSLSAVVQLKGDVRPSERTDFVFVLDASPTMQESIRNGEFRRHTFALLREVLAFDDDGVDFIVGSALTDDAQAKAAVWRALASGSPPDHALLQRAHIARLAGQCASDADVDAILEQPDASSGLGSFVAPALRLARQQRKPRGRLFIELITDGRIDDMDEAIQEIASMSKECGEPGSDRARYRLHILGVGDVDRDALRKLDEGLGTVAPVDIVASTLAAEHPQPAQTIFKEMQAYLTSGDAGLLEISAPALVSARINGEEMVEDGGGSFSISFERLALEFNLELEFSGPPTPTKLELMVGGMDPILFSVAPPVP
jgi:hypothetical protein